MKNLSLAVLWLFVVLLLAALDIFPALFRQHDNNKVHHANETTCSRVILCAKQIGSERSTIV